MTCALGVVFNVLLDIIQISFVLRKPKSSGLGFWSCFLNSSQQLLLCSQSNSSEYVHWRGESRRAERILEREINFEYSFFRIRLDPLAAIGKWCKIQVFSACFLRDSACYWGIVIYLSDLSLWSAEFIHSPILFLLHFHYSSLNTLRSFSEKDVHETAELFIVYFIYRWYCCLKHSEIY